MSEVWDFAHSECQLVSFLRSRSQIGVVKLVSAEL